MENEEAHELIPSPKRLIKSLRDIGYNFSSAVADLIDNSIEASASRVEIHVIFNGNNSFVRIADNGKGMGISELKEAMRYGSERIYHEEDLGKFGLGLKTASMSQCQCFSIASRNSKSKDIASFCWDLDRIEKTNRWEIFTPSKEKLIEVLHNPLKEQTGTVILWEKLDRILGYKHPYGEQARRKLNYMCRELEDYLAMVFHKFLSNEVPRKKLDIFINNNKIKPWDPFARDEPNTKKLSEIKIELEHEGINGDLILHPYILPSKDEFTSSGAFKNFSGPANWNWQQGFYIYRSNRMIQSGGWCGLRSSDEHTKLCRIELNFSPKFDNAFKINVAKMRVQLPIQIRDLIDETIVPIVRLAREYYDGKMKPPSKKPANLGSASSLGTETTSKNPSPQKFNGGNFSTNEQKFTLDEIEQKATSLASEKEKPIINQVFRRLRKVLLEGTK